MQHRLIITILAIFIAAGALVATVSGIWPDRAGKSYTYVSIRGKAVQIYGKGLYRDMSAEVAPQGIAQDYVTLFVGIPLLLLSLARARRGAFRANIILTGTLGYFLVNYLFYLVMGMYNALFLVYVFLAGTSFFAFVIQMRSFDLVGIQDKFSSRTPVKAAGWVLMIIAGSIALLWLSIVVPPLLDGSVVPLQVEHYTTLIVQGLDLAILLPTAFIAGLSFMRKQPIGYLLAPVYFVFLSLLMTALTAKVIAMGLAGANIIPVVFIIPVFNAVVVVGCCGVSLIFLGQEGAAGDEVGVMIAMVRRAHHDTEICGIEVGVTRKDRLLWSPCYGRHPPAHAACLQHAPFAQSQG